LSRKLQNLALDSELLAGFGGSDDENPCIFACYQGIWVSETSSLKTVSSTGESGANLISWIIVGLDAVVLPMAAALCCRRVSTPGRRWR
jgi:hypothetical protein